MKSIDWTKWSAIAEIVSSVAILLTLVYLAIQTQQVAIQNEQLVEQTRQNTDAIRSATIQEISRWSYDSTVVGIENADLRAARRAACDGDLTEDQWDLVFYYYASLVRLQANRFYQSELGVIDRETLMAIGGRGGAYSAPIFAEVWEEIGSNFEEGFQRFMEDEVLVLVEDSCPPSRYAE